MPWSRRLSLFTIICWLICTSAYPSQQILSEPGRQGSLWRFHGDPHEIEEILLHATDFDLDVWQIAHSHVDVYTPATLPRALSRFNPTLVSIPLSPARLDVVGERVNDGLDLDSLENTTFHSSYHTLFGVDDFMQELALLHPDLVKLVPLGHSGEGREMTAMTISRASDGEECQGSRIRLRPREKLGFVIIGAQHARDWISTAASLYLAHALVANSSEAHSMSTLLDSYNFYVIPAANPDGYVYTWEHDRFWYKNRMILGPYAKCVGLDMNRDTSGNGARVNSMARRRPFEAPEVNNIANFIATLPNLMAFVDLRSYGQMLSSPYAYSCKRVPKDAEDQLEAALGAVHALRLAHGTQFSTGSLCSMLYPAPGNVVDWMYARAGVKYSYAAHLRDTGTYGFVLPPEWIRPVGEESRNMIQYIAEFILRNAK